MKNPHDKAEYKKVDGEKPKETTETSSTPKSKFSGAYFYVNVDDKKLAEMSFARTLLTVIAFLLQIVALMLPQSGYAYVTDHYPSYAYAYVLFTLFGMIGVSFWLFVMNQVRYKFIKRIPEERAPRGGFKHRAYFGAELYMAVNAAMFVFELSFVCMSYNGAGLGALFVCAAATAASVAARQITHLTLKNSEYIPAPDANNDVDNTDNANNETADAEQDSTVQ